MEQTNEPTFDGEQLFDLFERLPETFQYQGNNRYAAMDGQHTYVLESLRDRDGLFPPDGFSLRQISRRELSYREHWFDICACTKGIELVEELVRFCFALREREKSPTSELELGDLKRAAREAKHSTRILLWNEAAAASDLVREGLTYVLSKEGIAGEILVILDDPLTINTNSGFLTLPVDISSVLDDFKPSLQLDVEDGELRSVNDASFRMLVPERNILDLMKARNALLTLGLPENTIQQLDEISLK